MNTIYKFLSCFLIVCMVCFTSCEIEEVFDPNNPSLASVTGDPSKAELQGLVTGLESRHRAYYGSATQMFGSFGREIWAFFGSDPRFTGDWLGIGLNGETYPDFFASAGTYTTPYLAVKQANVLVDAANASTSLTAAEKAAYSGFAKTVKGHQLLYPLLQQFENGIRIDVSDPLNPGPIVTYDEGLAALRAELDAGFSELSGVDGDLPFGLSAGYGGFETGNGLASINRAIAARAAIYAGDGAGALTALSSSFMNLDVTMMGMTQKNLQAGPAHVYGNSPDVSNPLFYPFDRPTSTIIVVHPALIEDAEAGDTRLSKFAQRIENPAESADVDFTGNYQDGRWASNTASIPYIRNEELILIYAEANMMTGNMDEAVNAINIIRNAHGLNDYSGGNSGDEIIDEILHQRRYSLWAEAGHRWVDLRRTGRLNADYVDLRDGGSLFTQVARRTSELN